MKLEKSTYIKLMVRLITGIVFLSFFFFCHSCGTEKPETLVNTLHLDHLSQTLNVNKQEMMIVHIYADYPDYEWTEAPGEGFTCIDDVARAAVFTIRSFHYRNQPESTRTLQALLEFILYMQAPNGLFYNFLFPDLSINTTHRNSQSRADWWSWRAIWALAEAAEYFEKENPEFASELQKRIERTFPAIDSLLSDYPETLIEDNIKLPRWLPYGTAADQAGVMILALIPYYRMTQNPNAKEYIQKLAAGISLMQLGDSLQFPYGSFLSWQNKWHAYGNSQAYALLEAGELLENNEFIQRALKEVKWFYPFLIKNSYLNEFAISRSDNSYTMIDRKDFSQIAYGIRPMVWACLKAHDITGEEKYANLAGEIACWLLGKNITGQALYDPQSGRCYDGINDPKTLNKNSGAESTIEALLTLLEAEQNSVARKIVRDMYLGKSSR